MNRQYWHVSGEHAAFKKIVFTVVSLAVASGVAFPSISHAATTDATLSFSPSSASTTVGGSNVTYTARVNPGSNTVEGVNAVQLDITFSTSVVHLVSVTAVSPFAILGTPDITTANTNGSISVPLYIASGQVTTTSDVATLVFSPQGSGTNSAIAYAATADAAVNDGSGTLVVATRTGATVTVTVPDVTAPSFTVNDGASASYVTSDTINVTVSDATGVASRYYGYSADSTCNASDTIATAFTSGTNFTIAGDHNDYLCLKATDSSSNANVGYQLVGQLYTDNTAPSFTVNDGASATSVKTDTVNVTVTDAASGVSTRTYGFSADNTCNASDTITTAFTSGTDFSIAGNYSTYLCLKATDALSNTSYQLVGQLHTDNTAPTTAQVTAVSSVTTSATPSYTFSSTEAGTISYSGGCTSSTTTAVSGSNTVTFTALTRGADYGSCTISVTDTAGNQSSAISVTTFAVTYRGDLNTDRSVGLSDLSMLATDFGRTSWSGHATDINGDGSVTISDLSILAADYGHSF